MTIILKVPSSKTHKFVNEEALANELAGHFILRLAEETGQAFEKKYNEWGAVAKAIRLTKYLDRR